MNARLVCALLTLLLCGLQYRLWFGANGVTEVQRFEARIALAQSANVELAAQNRILGAQVTELKSGNGGVESLARTELGMIREGETFYFQPGAR